MLWAVVYGNVQVQSVKNNKEVSCVFLILIAETSFFILIAETSYVFFRYLKLGATQAKAT